MGERSQQVRKARARQDDHPLCMYEILPRYPAGVGRSVALTSTDALSLPNLVLWVSGISRLDDLLTLSR